MAQNATDIVCFGICLKDNIFITAGERSVTRGIETMGRQSERLNLNGFTLSECRFPCIATGGCATLAAGYANHVFQTFF